jgi:esterase FrsA
MVNRLMWIWRGVDPREILDVQARIVMSEAERTDSELYDTVVGYRGGNWIYEWAKQAMLWQQKASHGRGSATLSGTPLAACGQRSTTIAAYPHLKGDELAEQAQALANRAYEEAAQRLAGHGCASWSLPFPGGAPDHRLPAYARRRRPVPDGADVRRPRFHCKSDYYSSV